jgi:hypothetical protein
VLACGTNAFYSNRSLVTIRAFTRERIGNGGCEHQPGRYPDQLSLTGLRLGRGTILVLFARAGAAAAVLPLVLVLLPLVPLVPVPVLLPLLPLLELPPPLD